jgi:hypothetical protein
VGLHWWGTAHCTLKKYIHQAYEMPKDPTYNAISSIFNSGQCCQTLSSVKGPRTKASQSSFFVGCDTRPEKRILRGTQKRHESVPPPNDAPYLCRAPSHRAFMHSSCVDPYGPRGQVGAYRGVPSLPSLTLFTSINVLGGALEKPPCEVHVKIEDVQHTAA